MLTCCGSVAPPPPPPPTAPSVPTEAVDPGAAVVTSDIGGLPEEAMGRAFKSLDGSVQSCLEDASGRSPTVGGSFTLKMRVGSDGKARWAYVSDSTLGDREAERCVLDLVREKQWPKPVGGDGLAERSYELDARAKPVDLEEKWVKSAVTKARENALHCRSGLSGKLRATAYIGSDGRVVAAAIVTPDEHFEEVADCVSDAIRKVRFGKVGKRMKLTFDLWW